MSDLFSDRLLDAIAAKGTPVCVGIDPIYEMLPDAVAGPANRRDANDAEACVDAIFAFTTEVLRTVAPLVPVVKFQSAYFEKYLWEGVEAYYSLIQEAKELGLLVIGDVKRGDIGSTSAAYAAAHLTDPPFDEHEDTRAPDAITINPFLGLDSIDPFVKAARDDGKGLFVLVRTSNPGAADLQDVKTDDGRTISEMLADKLKPVAAREGLLGDQGFSSIGAVVGTTDPAMMMSLRQRLPQSIFLFPGYGAQGASAEMSRAAFLHGKGAIISASRSILYAHRDAKHAAASNWKQAVASAVQEMRADVGRVLGG
ncbi:MAG TPA: orotidine-5'-phosphate decarboxylase [Tepidisphaeraceae bacterium]|nr:orotidine-5'-phosphate decarboxylase [Tepidisphaeraceae bacterium]